MQSVSLYDILSKVIPGALVFFFLAIYHWTKNEQTGDVLTLFLIYLVGYLVDTISGLLEHRILYWTFGGTPSDMLLKNKSFGGIKIYQIEILNQFMETNYPKLYPDKKASFRKIYSIVNKTEIPRVKNFLEAYAFSRNIFFAYLLSMPFF